MTIEPANNWLCLNQLFFQLAQLLLKSLVFLVNMHIAFHQIIALKLPCLFDLHGLLLNDNLQLSDLTPHAVVLILELLVFDLGMYKLGSQICLFTVTSFHSLLELPDSDGEIVIRRAKLQKFVLAILFGLGFLLPLSAISFQYFWCNLDFASILDKLVRAIDLFIDVGA
ncbi:hypothetical protein HG530_004366 [Fusarium avenaceum]|nr:hypothetical protein HG530_004366 [Fusarium avenaceum]